MKLLCLGAKLVLPVIFVISSMASCRADLLTGLEAYYPFDGNGLDASGNGRDLTLVNNPGFAAGIFGQALDLHGNNSQYAVRPVDDSAFNFGSNDFTIQAWVNFNTVSHEQTLIEKFFGQTGPDWTLTTAFGGNVYQFYANGGAVELNSNTAPTANVWHDVIVERSGSSFGLYIDGVLVSSETYSGALSGTTMPLMIGKRNDFDGRDLSVDGRIDDVAIWDRALSTDEINTLWNGGTGTPVFAPVPVPSTLVMSSIMFGMVGVVWSYRRWKQPASAT